MRFELTREFLEDLREAIDNNQKEKVKTELSVLHQADIAEIFDELNIEEAKFVYLLLETEKAADVLVELEEDVRERFLKVLSGEVIAKQFIDNMDSDDAADILGELSDEMQEEVLKYINDTEQAGDIVDLLNYDEDTAGGLMAKELIAVNENWSMITCLKEMRKQAEEIDEVYYVYVINDENKLKGTLSLKKLLLSSSTAKVGEVSNHDIISVHVNADSEEVANIMDKYDLVALPVVDSIDRLVGRITIDDVVEVIREEAEKDYQMMSGISEDVESSDKVWVLTRARLPWLLVGLGGGILGAQVVTQYEHDLAENAVLAAFLPLIAAMGGNVGVQSSAIVIQSLVARNIDIHSTASKLIKESAVGMINGITCASLIFAYNFFFSDSFALTITVSLSLFIVIIFASLFGTFVPLALNRFKIDPALATGPFITTVNDILGLFIYLFLGRIIFAMF